MRKKVTSASVMKLPHRRLFLLVEEKAYASTAAEAPKDATKIEVVALILVDKSLSDSF